MNVSHCSKNEYHIKKMSKDMLLWPYITVRTAYNVLKLAEFIIPNSYKLRCPVLLIHGKENRITSHMNSIDFYRLISSKEKTLKIYE